MRITLLERCLDRGAWAPQVSKEPLPPPTDRLPIVEPAGNVDQTLLQTADGHPHGNIIDVEERTLVPGSLLEDPPLAVEARVERGAGEWSHDRHLDIIEPRPFRELVDRIEDALVVPVQAEHEASIHGDPSRLDRADRGRVGRELSELPVPPHLHAIQ